LTIAYESAAVAKRITLCEFFVHHAKIKRHSETEELL